MSLFYTFPVIRSIDDVLPCIDNNFRVVEKEGLTFINYNVMSPDAFPPVVEGSGHAIEEVARRAAVRRECRGITFDTASGRIVSRPFHKFFNVNERPDVTIDLLGDVGDHTIFEKLDGSMLRPLPVAGGIRWGTKMGVTDTALLAEEFVADKPEYREMADTCMSASMTPIFEFCSRRARIVVDYPNEQMVLLAIRQNETGAYVPRASLEEIAEQYGIPLVQTWGGHTGSAALIERVRNMDTGEGIILSVGGGHAVKIKADAYVRLHKAKDHLRSEMDLLDLALNESLDDVLPILSNDEQDKVWAYLTAFDGAVETVGQEIDKLFADARDRYETKAAFAIASTMPQPWKGRVLDLWSGKYEDGIDAIMTNIRRLMSSGTYGQPGYKARSSNTHFEQIKESYGLNTGWNDIMHEMAEAA